MSITQLATERSQEKGHLVLDAGHGALAISAPPLLCPNGQRLDSQLRTGIACPLRFKKRGGIPPKKAV